MLQQDPSIPTAAKRGNKIKRIARELIAFCRQNGVLKLALTRQQCSQFFISRDIPNAKHVVAAIDKNNDGVCDFREIVIGAVTAGDAKAGPMHSAKLLFDSYDNDKSGSIDSQEVHLLMFSFLLFFFSSSIFWFIYSILNHIFCFFLCFSTTTTRADVFVSKRCASLHRTSSPTNGSSNVWHGWTTCDD
jgi:hypothetical protein